MLYHYAALTCRGSKHPRNQDCILLSSHLLRRGMRSGSITELLTVVCDGAGGEAGGGAAAAVAAAAMAPLDPAHAALPAISEQLWEAHRRVCDLRRHWKRPCTALAGVLVRQGSWYFFGLGHVRVYHFDGNRLRQCSRDDTMARRQLITYRIGSMKDASEEARHTLTACLGGPIPSRGFAVRAIPRPLTGTLLVCTNGLYEAVEEQEISEVLSSGGSPNEKAQTLASLALARGLGDDISLVLLSV